MFVKPKTLNTWILIFIIELYYNSSKSKFCVFNLYSTSHILRLNVMENNTLYTKKVGLGIKFLSPIFHSYGNENVNDLTINFQIGPGHFMKPGG